MLCEEGLDFELWQCMSLCNVCIIIIMLKSQIFFWCDVVWFDCCCGYVFFRFLTWNLSTIQRIVRGCCHLMIGLCGKKFLASEKYTLSAQDGYVSFN